MTDHPVPKTQIETLQGIIEGYYEAADAGDLVEDEDVSDESEFSTDVIKRQKKFLADIGLLHKDGYDYTLLEPGRDIGRALAFDREADAAETFRQQLEEWEVTNQVRDDIGIGTRTKNEIIDSLAYLTETDTSVPRKQTGLSALVDIYVWTGILSETEGGELQLAGSISPESDTDSEQVDSVIEAEEEHNGQSVDKKADSSVPNGGETGKQDSPLVNLDSGVLSVDLELSGDEDPENVKRLIVAIREGLQYELNSDNQETDQSENEDTESDNDHKSLNSF